MMNNWGGMGSGGWIIALLVLVVVVAVIVAIVYLVRGMGASGAGSGSVPPQTSSRESPQDVLKRRYAAGEIDRGEYEQKMRDLSS
jgi:putative membrane protein